MHVFINWHVYVEPLGRSRDEHSWWLYILRFMTKETPNSSYLFSQEQKFRHEEIRVRSNVWKRAKNKNKNKRRRRRNVASLSYWTLAVPTHRNDFLNLRDHLWSWGKISSQKVRIHLVVFKITSFLHPSNCSLCRTYYYSFKLLVWRLLLWHMLQWMTKLT